MQLKHIMQIKISNLGSSVRVGKIHEMSVFGESIYNHKHYKLQMGLRQTFIKVHAHIQPWFLRNGQGLQQSSRKTSFMLKFLIGVTLLHILLQILPQARPNKILLKLVQGL